MRQKSGCIFMFGLIMAVFTGCGNKMETIKSVFSNAVIQEEKPESESEPGESSQEALRVYLKELEKLNQAAEEFAEAGTEFTALAEKNEGDPEELSWCVEKMRSTKQAFLDFSELTEVPEGFETAHAKMVGAVTAYAGYIDSYCDILLANIRGEEHPKQDTVPEELERVSDNLADAMEEIKETAGEVR